MNFVATLLAIACMRDNPGVVTYEGNDFPENEGWERVLADTPGAQRSIVDGWLVQRVDLPDGWPGPNGDYDFYRTPLLDFAGSETFFVEWRATTDNPSWLLDLNAVPVVVVAGGRGAGFYHTTITDTRVQFFRDTDFALKYASIEAEIAHRYRLELRGTASYVWYIDGAAVESGNPEGAYPDATSELVWGAGREYLNATTAWDYVRFGVIPVDGSGDYDSDGALSLFDFYFVDDCLTKDGPGIFGGPAANAGPGCRFTDFDGDNDADLFDFAAFANRFTGGS